MTKKSLLISATAGIIYLTVSSFSGGTFSSQGNLTGTAGSTSTCSKAGCHAGGASTTTGSIEVRRKDWGASSTPVDHFEAGMEYIVTLKGSNANASLNNFGFQLLATDASNNPIGTFSNPPAGVKTASSNQVLEHSMSLAKNGSGDYEVTANWTAPASVTGSITFNAVINAVNGNSNTMGDDVSGAITRALNNKTSVANIANVTVFNVFPNPVRNTLTVDMQKAATGEYHFRVLNSAGSIVYDQISNVTSNYQSQINTSNWAAGNYFIHVSKDGHQKVLPVVKQ